MNSNKYRQPSIDYFNDHAAYMGTNVCPFNLCNIFGDKLQTPSAGPRALTIIEARRSTN